MPTGTPVPATNPLHGASNMPISDETIIRPMIATEGLECPLAGSYADYGDVAIRRVMKQWNDPEHRDRPVPLLGNPTSQAAQYEAIRGYHAQKYVYPTGSNYCNPPGEWFHNTSRTIYRYRLPSEFRDIPDPEGDWGLALRSRLAGRKQNLGAYLAEYRETAKSFSDAARALGDVLKCLRGNKGACGSSKRRFTRYNKPDIHAVTKQAANAVLMANFGINPLLADLGEGIRRLNSRMARPILGKVVASVRTSGFEVVDYISQNSGSDYGLHVHAVHMWNSSDRAIMWYRVDPGFTGSDDFTMGSPLQALWEGTPYSFVVDWMIPVGDYLAAADALRGIDVVETTVTRKRSSSSRDSSTLPGWSLVHAGVASYKTHSRSVADEIPLPLPRFEPSKSARSLLNATALLRSVWLPRGKV
jgi:hypothetical protein